MAENWDYISRDQAIDEAIELRKAIEDHVCDHTNCIPRSELPGLPDGITPGFTAKNLREMEWLAGDWEWIAALLNTCYPAPTATETKKVGD